MCLLMCVWFVQDMALANEESMPMFIRCGINALVAAYLNFLSQMIANPPFCQHVSKVRPSHILTSLLLLNIISSTLKLHRT